ncbi:hypothetical protein [Sutcliffiella horikoshii]|nr:hypothetical protein [Sutcliffiella horikoshii]
MDWMSIIRYACSLTGIVCLGFTYKHMLKSARAKGKSMSKD